MTSQFYYFLTDNQYQLTTAVYWPIYRCMYQHKRKNYFGDSRHRSQVLKILINFATLFDPDTIKLKKKDKKERKRAACKHTFQKASLRGLTYVGSNLAALIKRGTYPLLRRLKENIPSQLLPLKPEGQEHLYDLPSSSHDPPFLQGLGIHLLITDEITWR